MQQANFMPCIKDSKVIFALCVVVMKTIHAEEGFSSDPNWKERVESPPGSKNRIITWLQTNSTTHWSTRQPKEK